MENNFDYLYVLSFDTNTIHEIEVSKECQDSNDDILKAHNINPEYAEVLWLENKIELNKIKHLSK